MEKVLKDLEYELLLYNDLFDQILFPFLDDFDSYDFIDDEYFEELNLTWRSA